MHPLRERRHDPEVRPAAAVRWDEHAPAPQHQLRPQLSLLLTRRPCSPGSILLRGSMLWTRPCSWAFVCQALLAPGWDVHVCYTWAGGYVH